MKLLGIIKENEKGNIIIPMNIIINKINFIKCIYSIKNKDIDKEIELINDKGYLSGVKNQEIEKEIFSKPPIVLPPITSMQGRFFQGGTIGNLHYFKIFKKFIKYEIFQIILSKIYRNSFVKF